MPGKRIRGATGEEGAARVAASVFKDTCLELLERVRQTREEIVVTKYGKPVAKLVPFDEVQPSLYGVLKGSVTIMGDILAPLDEPWDAERGA